MFNLNNNIIYLFIRGKLFNFGIFIEFIYKLFNIKFP